MPLPTRPLKETPKDSKLSEADRCDLHRLDLALQELEQSVPPDGPRDARSMFLLNV